jgi:hypothetical protein
MSDPTHLASETSDTPKTDAVLVRIKIEGEEFFGEQLVRADFAREQERRIMELVDMLREIIFLAAFYGGTRANDECSKARALVAKVTQP